MFHYLCSIFKETKFIDHLGFLCSHIYALTPSMTTSQPLGMPLAPRFHLSVLVTNVPCGATPDTQFVYSRGPAPSLSSKRILMYESFELLENIYERLLAKFANILWSPKLNEVNDVHPLKRA